MKEPRRIEGRWWINGPDQEPHFGILTFDAEKGIELEVKIATGMSVNDFLTINQTSSGPNVIVGRDKQDKIVALFGCHRRGWSHSMGMKEYKIGAFRVLIGLEFADWNSACFRFACCELSLLHNWMGRSSVTYGTDSQGSLTISAAPDSEIVLSQISEGLDMKIIHITEQSAEFAKHTITQKHRVAFLLKQPLSVADFLTECLWPLRNLLTLFTGKPVYFERITFEDSEKAELLMRNEGVTSANRDQHHGEMLVPYNEIADNATAIFRKWYSYVKQLDSVLNLYFSTVFNKALYGPHKFLFLAQALEVYHGASSHSFTKFVQSKSDFSARVQNIIENAPDADKEWLKEKLHYANQKTLAQKLADIRVKYDAEITRIIPNPEEFFAKVRHTRNYYTHFDSELKERGKVFEDTELAQPISQMRALLQICILKDLGVCGAPIQRIISEYQNIRICGL